MTMEKEILAWFVNGERGISSEVIASVAVGLKPNASWARFSNHPSDPDDFKRCVKLLIEVPKAREYLKNVAKLSKTWKNLIDNWDELEALFHEEYHTGKAPKLYARMKKLGC